MKNLTILLLLFLSVTSCNRDFLDVKPDKKLIVPVTLDDFEALLDYSDLMNRFLPPMNEIQADDYFWDYNGWINSFTPEYKNAYVWGKNIYEGESTISDWNLPYNIIFQANNALDGLDNMSEIHSGERYNKIKGRALFFRALSFFYVAQVYCGPFDSTNDNSAFGIPLRLTSDINVSSHRSTIKETYDQIIDDLQMAEGLLPQTESIKTRPSKSAVQALLSRVYLSMQNYEMALKYADLVIESEQFTLIDFTTLDLSVNYPMQRLNQEVIFHSEMESGGPIAVSQINIDTTLYESYSESDLRKTAWFRFQNGKMRFRGSYNGSAIYFNGLAIDECYVTKSECLARLGRYTEAIQVLNLFLATRHQKFTNMVVGRETDVLHTILLERRKALLLRGIRWTDLRRLNLENHTAKTLKRNLNGTIYTLAPNSANYILPIQPNVIRLTNISQNIRD